VWDARKGLIALGVFVIMVTASVAAWPFIRNLGRPPGCTVTAAAESGAAVTFPLSGEQADKARDSRSYDQPPTWGALRQSAVRPAERGCLARVGG
jgi:hypothetical protein